MNAKFELEAIPENTLSIAFESETGIKAIVQNIKNQVEEQISSVVWDLGKKKDRDLIASLARKVASSKTTIDAEGKRLKEKYTVVTSKIDADRKFAREELDQVRDEIRKPLTDWESAKRAREAEIQSRITEIRKHATEGFLLMVTAELISGAINLVEEIVIDSSFEEFEQEAKLAKFETLETLRKTLVEREKYEAEQAELKAKRQAEALRLQQERDAQIAREATEKAQREAEEKASFEAERVQREKAESEQREARLKAEKEAAILREEALKQKAIDDAKQAEIDKQNAIEAERKRVEQQRLAQAEAERKAEEARKADVEYRRWINNEALIAFKNNGVDEAIAKQVIAAIAKNQIPHISIKY